MPAKTPPHDNNKNKAKPAPPRRPKDSDPRPNPPDSIPDPLPGVDPEQTPGIDHLPAERE